MLESFQGTHWITDEKQECDYIEGQKCLLLNKIFVEKPRTFLAVSGVPFVLTANENRTITGTFSLEFCKKLNLVCSDIEYIV